MKSQKLKNKNAGGVAFENPSYLRETNVEHVHVSCCDNLSIFSYSRALSSQQIQTISTNQQPDSSTGPAVISPNNSHSNGIASASEVNPTLYEEYVKLGKEKGFKKLVS